MILSAEFCCISAVSAGTTGLTHIAHVIAHHPALCSLEGSIVFTREMQGLGKEYWRPKPFETCPWNLCSITVSEFYWPKWPESQFVIKGKEIRLFFLIGRATMGVDMGRNKGPYPFFQCTAGGHSSFHFTGEGTEIQSLYDTRLCRF